MKCVLKDTGRIHQPTGFYIYQCARPGCGAEAKSPYHPDNIQSHCRGFPLASEYKLWVDLLCEATGLTRAAAIVRFIRWRAAGSPLDALPPGIQKPQLPPPEQGPGTELHKLIAALGITPDASCGCEAMRLKMNQWGPEGCAEHRAEIMEHLTKAYHSTDWTTYLRACANAAALRIFSLEDLLDEAIRRAET